MNSLRDYSDVAVPDNEGPRFKWLYLTNVENAVTICVPVFLFGASLGSSLSAINLSIALLAAGSLLCLLSGWTSYIGVKTRLSTSLLIQKSFGVWGGHLVRLFVAVSLFGWFGVQTEIFAKTFLLLLGKVLPDFAISPALITIVSGLLMASTAVLGIKGVGKLAQLAIPLLLGVMIYGLVEGVLQGNLNSWLNFVPRQPMTLGSAIAAILGGYSVGVTVMPDIKRFALNAKHSVVSGALAIGVCYPVLLLCTALTTALFSQFDYLEILVQLGLGSFSLVILLLATWTTNDLNLYSASLSLAPIFPRIPRAWLTAVSGVAGTILASFGIFERMIPLFMMFGVLTMPLLAIYTTDFLFKRPATESSRRMTTVLNFVIWAAASFLGLAATPGDQLGLGLFPSLTTVSGLDTLAVSALLCIGRVVVEKSASRLLSKAQWRQNI